MEKAHAFCFCGKHSHEAEAQAETSRKSVGKERTCITVNYLPSIRQKIIFLLDFIKSVIKANAKGSKLKHKKPSL